MENIQISESKKHSVSCHSVSKRYVKKTLFEKVDVTALNDVSFDVKQGEIFGIIGPDGAGKTTLFRILSTLILGDSGNITIEGLDVIKDFRTIRTLVGYMPGRFSLYQDLTVEENLNVFAKVFNTSITENYHLIEEIYKQLEPFKKRRAGKLSGGMKQKLALCCALIHKPKVLFLDEPTTGVDPVSRKEFWEMLKRLKEENITILVSTPYMDEASMCDRIALIQNGRFLKIDSPQNIIKQFDHDLWLVRSDNMSKLLTDLRAFQNVRSCFAFGDSHHITMFNNDWKIDELKMFLVQKGHTSIEIERTEVTVEDCFMELNLEPKKSLNTKNTNTKEQENTEISPIVKLEQRTNSEIVISTENLTKKFGSFTAVDKISFNVKKGEIFGFLGANGAGKTTAMRMLTGLSHPTSGSGTVAGFDIKTQTEQIKKNIGYMSQKFALYDDLKVWENIRLYAGIYGVPEQEISHRTDELLKKLGFDKERNALVKSLPLGWKQKLAFSVAIFHEPKIVFLDEPTGGVDPSARRNFWEMIYEASDRGITVFVTTHYMDEADYCNRVSIMVGGKIEVLDSPKNLKLKYNAENMNEVFYKIARTSNLNAS